MAKILHFTVVGTGRFPVSMLCGESAWPASNHDAQEIERTFGAQPDEQITVRLSSAWETDPEMWEGTGWHVEQAAE